MLMIFYHKPYSVKCQALSSTLLNKYIFSDNPHKNPIYLVIFTFTKAAGSSAKFPVRIHRKKCQRLNACSPAASKATADFLLRSFVAPKKRKVVLFQVTKHDIFFFILINNFKSHFFIHSYSIVCFLYGK